MTFIKRVLFTLALALAALSVGCGVEYVPESSAQPPVYVTVYETIEAPVYVTVTFWPVTQGGDSAPQEGDSSKSVGSLPPEAVSGGGGITATSGDVNVAKGGKAKLSIIGKPNTEYAIKVYLPSGSKSTAKGVEPKTTDDTGYVEWTWNVSRNTKAGVGKCVVSGGSGSDGDSVTVALNITD